MAQTTIQISESLLLLAKVDGCVCMVQAQICDWAGAVLMCMCGELIMCHIEMGTRHYVSGCDVTLMMNGHFSACQQLIIVQLKVGAEQEQTFYHLCIVF